MSTNRSLEKVVGSKSGSQQQRIRRLEALLKKTEADAKKLAKVKHPSEKRRREIGWAFARIFTEGEILKQPEAIGRAYIAFMPLIAQVPLTTEGFYLLSQKMQDYDKCRKSCKKIRNRTLRKLCISHCILVLMLCLKPGESPN
ncbi:MAG: hypothetical protein ACQ9MH_12500 [Nitrospinales bacterium]